MCIEFGGVLLPMDRTHSSLRGRIRRKQRRIRTLGAEGAEEFRDSVCNIIGVANENAANDVNSANLRESEDRVKRRKDLTNSSRPGTNLIVSNAEDAKVTKVVDVY